MALHLSPMGIRHHVTGLRDRARGMLAGADKHIATVVRTSEISLASFGFGMVQGRFKDKGGVSLMGVPVDLLAGTAFHVLALFGIGGANAHHLHAFGDGALASFFNTTGYRVGESWAKKGGGISGLFGDDAPARQITGGSTVADSALADLVAAD